MSIVCLSRLFFSDLGIAAGKVDVAATVTIDQEMQKLDDARLGWGIETVIATSIERVGSATRRFSIEVSR